MAHVPNEYKLPRMAKRAVQERLKGSYILLPGTRVEGTDDGNSHDTTRITVVE